MEYFPGPLTESPLLWFRILNIVCGAMCSVAIAIVILRIDEKFRTRQIRHHRTLRRVQVWSLTGILFLNLLGFTVHEFSVFQILVIALSVAVPMILMFVISHLRMRHHDNPKKALTILAVGAHPDDIELGCGATVAKMVDKGHHVHALVLSRGRVGGNIAERFQEARTGARLLGIDELEILDFPDTNIQTEVNRAADAIERVIDLIQPDLILTHSEHDQHQDHHAVHLATLRAARRHHSILCYESPSATRNFNPSIFIDVEDYVEIKIEAVKAHIWQASKPYMTSHRLRGMTAFRGQQCRINNAEGFEPVRLIPSKIGAFQ